jgi:hypothetical protein
MADGELMCILKAEARRFHAAAGLAKSAADDDRTQLAHIFDVPLHQFASVEVSHAALANHTNPVVEMLPPRAVPCTETGPSACSGHWPKTCCSCEYSVLVWNGSQSKQTDHHSSSRLQAVLRCFDTVRTAYYGRL